MRDINEAIWTKLLAATYANYLINWAEPEPNNMGGRTCALWADLYYTDRIFAGGVISDLWKISNTSTSPTWVKVSGNFDNMVVATFAQNPTDKQYRLCVVMGNPKTIQ